jgi:hypothetical protein
MGSRLDADQITEKRIISLVLQLFRARLRWGQSWVPIHSLSGGSWSPKRRPPRFLKARTVAHGPDHRVRCGKVYENYRAWCAEQKIEPLSLTRFRAGRPALVGHRTGDRPPAYSARQGRGPSVQPCTGRGKPGIAPVTRGGPQHALCLHLGTWAPICVAGYQRCPTWRGWLVCLSGPHVASFDPVPEAYRSGPSRSMVCPLRDSRAAS